MFDMFKKPEVKNMEMFEAALRKAKLRFESDRKKCNVDVSFSGNNLKSFTFSFFFNKDGKSVTVFALDVVTFAPEKYDQACRICNELNAEALWLRYMVNQKDGSMDAETQIPVRGKDAGEICVYVLGEIVEELDGACARFN